MTTKSSEFSDEGGAIRGTWQFSIGDWGYDDSADSAWATAIILAPDDDIWIEHLALHMELESRNGAMEITELVIRPGQQHPEGGVVTVDLRHIPLHAISQDVMRNLGSGESPDGWIFAPPAAPKGWATSLAKRPGRAGKPDIHYALVAAEYVRHLGEPKPLARLAKELPLEASQVRSILYEARRRGLLTDPTVPGRAGGELTPKALDILRQHDEGTER
jgi:hypothetical protein